MKFIKYKDYHINLGLVLDLHRGFDHERDKYRICFYGSGFKDNGDWHFETEAERDSVFDWIIKQAEPSEYQKELEPEEKNKQLKEMFEDMKGGFCG